MKDNIIKTIKIIFSFLGVLVFVNIIKTKGFISGIEKLLNNMKAQPLLYILVIISVAIGSVIGEKINENKR